LDAHCLHTDDDLDDIPDEGLNGPALTSFRGQVPLLPFAAPAELGVEGMTVHNPLSHLHNAAAPDVDTPGPSHPNPLTPRTEYNPLAPPMAGVSWRNPLSKPTDRPSPTAPTITPEEKKRWLGMTEDFDLADADQSGCDDYFIGTGMPTSNALSMANFVARNEPSLDGVGSSVRPGREGREWRTYALDTHYLDSDEDLYDDPDDLLKGPELKAFHSHSPFSPRQDDPKGKGKQKMSKNKIAHHKK